VAPIGRVRGFGVFDRAMPKGGDVHVPLARAVDPLGNPALRTARSRKVQKGEDTSFETLDATWVARRVDGAPVGAGDGPTANTRVTDGDVAVRFSAFGLFDGHGGKACAEHCAATMLDRIVRALDAPGPVPAGADADDAFEARLPAALRDAFAACDTEFLAKDVHSGATATVVVVHGRCVTTASVGDSLAVLDLGVTTGAAAPAARLSPEHRLDTSAAERERIIAAGGEVRATAFEDGQPVGPLRVWPGGLAVSRTVGDRDGKKGGVVSEPEVSRVVVPDEQPGFRITLASDGLWDAVTVKQAAQCAGRLATAAAAAALCKRAQKQKDNRDDITVLVVDALADPAHKDPFQEKPPWKVAFKVKWPLRGAPGKEPVLDDPVEVPPPSARARWRLEAGAREAAAAAAAAAEARERAEAVEAARRADARSAPRGVPDGADGAALNDRGGLGGGSLERRAVRGGHAARLAGEEEEEEAAAAVERGAREARVRPRGEPRRKARTAPGRARRSPERARRRERRREGGWCRPSGLRGGGGGGGHAQPERLRRGGAAGAAPLRGAGARDAGEEGEAERQARARRRARRRRGGGGVGRVYQLA
jgi:serine/threonine protein phosphatase PrpC